jgi:hypothetical protein
MKDVVSLLKIATREPSPRVAKLKPMASSEWSDANDRVL